jgi:hypothetical protein
MSDNVTPIKLIPSALIAVSGRHARVFIEGWLRSDPEHLAAHHLERRCSGAQLDLDFADRMRRTYPGKAVLIQHLRGDVRRDDCAMAVETISATEADVRKVRGSTAWNQRVRLTDAGPVLVKL